MDVEDRLTTTPLTDAELIEWEARARNSDAWSSADVRRLIEEVRRSRGEWDPVTCITRDPDRCSGDPTVAETRICVHHVVALAPRYDWELERLREREFPDLTLLQMYAAAAYYLAHREEIEETLRHEQEMKERLPLAPVGKRE